MASLPQDQPQEQLEAWNGRFTGRCITKRLGRQRAARAQYLDPSDGSFVPESRISPAIAAMRWQRCVPRRET
jgi:hypothetical protein